MIGIIEYIKANPKCGKTQIMSEMEIRQKDLDIILKVLIKQKIIKMSYSEQGFSVYYCDS